MLFVWGTHDHDGIEMGFGLRGSRELEGRLADVLLPCRGPFIRFVVRFTGRLETGRRPDLSVRLARSSRGLEDALKCTGCDWSLRRVRPNGRLVGALTSHFRSSFAQGGQPIVEHCAWSPASRFLVFGFTTDYGAGRRVPFAESQSGNMWIDAHHFCA